MSSTLFAFQVARPLESASAEQKAPIGQYDPQTQTLQWQGQDRAQAFSSHCTAHHHGYTFCTILNGQYCNLWGPIRVTGGYYCDVVA